MIHRRLTTAGIDVAPHYHQLIVIIERGIRSQIKRSGTLVGPARSSVRCVT